MLQYISFGNIILDNYLYNVNLFKLFFSIVMYLLWQKVIHSFLFIINLWTTNLCSIDTDTGTCGHGDTYLYII